jgi:hypothetical protein
MILDCAHGTTASFPPVGFYEEEDAGA